MAIPCKAQAHTIYLHGPFGGYELWCFFLALEACPAHETLLGTVGHTSHPITITNTLATIVTALNAHACTVPGYGHWAEITHKGPQKLHKQKDPTFRPRTGRIPAAMVCGIRVFLWSGKDNTSAASTPQLLWSWGRSCLWPQDSREHLTRGFRNLVFGRPLTALELSGPMWPLVKMLRLGASPVEGAPIYPMIQGPVSPTPKESTCPDSRCLWEIVPRAESTKSYMPQSLYQCSPGSGL